jgi:cation:H+ antiporter
MIDFIIPIAFCIGGLFALIKGADIMIDGAVVISHKLNISEMIVGIVLLAFGTSAPEMVVNFLSSYQGKGDIVVGNIVGSNIVNLALGIGLAALISPLIVERKLLFMDIPLAILAILFFFIISYFFPSAYLLIGLIMVGIFSLYLYHIIKTRGIDEEEQENDDDIKSTSLPKAIFITIFGLVTLLLGGELTVRGGVDIARLFDIRETLIGLTIISIGTSLPEIVTCISAAKKGKNDIAVGNIVGSQIFNALWVLGGSSIIADIIYDKIIYADVAFLTVLSLYFLICNKIFSKNLHKLAALILIIAYGGYLLFILNREMMFF